MLRTYYRIWIDAIVIQKKSKSESGSWKLLTIIPISVLQGLNLLTLLFIIRWISNGSTPIVLSLNISGFRAINTFLGGALIFFVFFVILNYLLIFNNNRYQNLLRIYTDSKGRLYRNYALITVGIIVVPMLLKLVF
ncbi:hypothetical protein SAMN05216464_112141 [Mucilaginibacter pineti]|uniref:Uncharacterized protein n=1 Tax=Mucilaginibacter pineti TaxID=1391627 RepID=A0A1G7I3Q4_9SPHI|nr:hypothetical protein [Mucilaginibacter pineti]SDF07362.1 hypothetical protein SAMN05216464_112141 [Mucilaginibacter pineti]